MSTLGMPTVPRRYLGGPFDGQLRDTPVVQGQVIPIRVRGEAEDGSTVELGWYRVGQAGDYRWLGHPTGG